MRYTARPCTHRNLASGRRAFAIRDTPRAPACSTGIAPTPDPSRWSCAQHVFAIAAAEGCSRQTLVGVVWVLRTTRAVLDWKETQGVSMVGHPIANVGIEVEATIKPDRVFAKESSRLRVIESRSVVVQPCLWIPLAAGEGVANVARSHFDPAPRVVPVLMHDRAHPVRRLHNRPQPVCVVERRGTRAIFPRQGLVEP